MNGDPVWHPIIGWLLASISLLGIGFVVILVIDTVRGRSGLTPVVNQAGTAIEHTLVLIMFFLLFYFALGALRP